MIADYYNNLEEEFSLVLDLEDEIIGRDKVLVQSDEYNLADVNIIEGMMLKKCGF